MRIVVFSHGHPLFSKGGGEIAAHNLFRGLFAAGHEAWFIARADASLLNPNSRLSLVGPNEFILAGTADIESLSSPIPYWRGDDLVRLLKEIDPDVVHLHHYVHLGIELIRTVRNEVPGAKIFLTLHEYIAICSNFGQMIKTSGRLCYQSSPRECSQCFPERQQEHFFLRERYIKSFFRLVNAFISPSQFLKDRYVNWGLPAESISIIENGLPDGDRLPPRPLIENEGRSRFAYFGQINPFKGVDLILEAFSRLPKQVRKRVSLDIYGSGLQWQAAEFRAKVETLIEQMGRIATYHDAYEQSELPTLMAHTDWVIMGSIWWENSPVVIQEAFKFGRPLICPDIGGMAEKVSGDRGGYLYRARDSACLAQVVSEVSIGSEAFDRALSLAPDYQTIENCVRQHMIVYERS